MTREYGASLLGPNEYHWARGGYECHAVGYQHEGNMPEVYSVMRKRVDRVVKLRPKGDIYIANFVF